MRPWTIHSSVALFTSVLHDTTVENGRTDSMLFCVAVKSQSCLSNVHPPVDQHVIVLMSAAIFFCSSAYCP